MLAARKSMFFEDVHAPYGRRGLPQLQLHRRLRVTAPTVSIISCITCWIPTGMASTGQYMATAASNLIRPGIGRGG